MSYLGCAFGMEWYDYFKDISGIYKTKCVTIYAEKY